MVSKSYCEDWEALIECICLVFHEARNVRSPIKKGKVSNSDRFQKLTSLDKDRKLAWQQMAHVRERARITETAALAAEVFAGEYGLKLDDLRVLFEAPIWYHDSAYGGSVWGGISKAVLRTVESWDATRDNGRHQLIEDLIALSHHSGTMGSKLKLLRDCRSRFEETK